VRSHTTTAFRNAFDGLPVEIQERARDAFAAFVADPHHPGLRLKRVHPTEQIYSARVTRSYRALAVLEDGDVWIWFWIGSHADYDKLLSRL